MIEIEPSASVPFPLAACLNAAHEPTELPHNQIDDSNRLFPRELKVLRRWVVWKYETRDGKSTKVLYDARTKRRADSTDDSTWAGYWDAVAAQREFSGIGCVIDDPYCAIDLDKCRDPDTGTVEAWAEWIISELASYTELSPSGRGFHVWLRARKPEGSICKRGRIECYDGARYFTVTGQHVQGTPKTIEQRDLSSFLERLKAGELEPSPTQAAAVLTQPSEAQNSQSEIDFKVCVDLANKWGNNAAQIEAEFNKTEHAQREKWRNRPDYRERTIRRAIEVAATNEPTQIIEGDDLPVESVPTYPTEIIVSGDLIADMAHALADGTPVPLQFVRENIKTVVGAVIDGRVGFPGQEDIHTRQFNINVSLHPRSGKGESWKRVAGFGAGILEPWFDDLGVRVISSGIGSGEALIKNLSNLEENCIHQVILRYDELGELLAKSQVLGSSLEYKLLSFYETRAGSAASLTHGDIAVEDIGVSLCGDFVEQDFTAAFSGRGSAGRGFLPRCVLAYVGEIPSVGDWAEINGGKTIKICRDMESCLDLMQRTAERGKRGRWVPEESDAARTIRLEFFQWLKAQDPRLTPELPALMKRDLIHRALFSAGHNITPEKTERSISWCKHQLALREMLWPLDAGDKVEQMSARILKALDGRVLSTRRLLDYCHVERLGSGGPEAFHRALKSLTAVQRIGILGKTRRGQNVYGLL